MSLPTAQGKSVNKDGINYTTISVFKVKCKEMKGRAFDVRSALVINVFSTTIHEMMKIIIHTYKNGIDVKRCL